MNIHGDNIQWKGQNERHFDNLTPLVDLSLQLNKDFSMRRES